MAPVRSAYRTVRSRASGSRAVARRAEPDFKWRESVWSAAGPVTAIICAMLEVETAAFIVFLVVVFAVMIAIPWYGTIGGRGEGYVIK